MRFSSREKFASSWIGVVACLMLLAGCAEEPAPQAVPQAETEAGSVVEVTATHDHVENRHLFELSSREIPSGWTTFRFRNASPSDHFFLLYKVPAAAVEAADAAGESLLDHWLQGVVEPFQNEYNPYVRGEIGYQQFVDNLVAAIQEKGPWFFDPGAPVMGGPGFTAAGRTSETTVQLEPGEYIVECYVKDANEEFHSYLGMLDALTVTSDASGAEPPTATARMTLSSTGGFQIDPPLRQGSHTIEVFFEDQISYEHMLGHNVQLAQLRDGTDGALISRLASWMDWRQKGSLVDRAPEGAVFLGGVMEMTEGSTAYYHVDLTPGDYVWIAEIPDPAAHGMLETFTVAD
jgi:hypothetical protein